MTTETFEYDVFISYSSANKDWVRKELLPAIEKAGLKVCIDFRDFEPGAPSVIEMERAVKTSRKTLLILTPAYLKSNWAEFENTLLQTLDPANRERRLIPLLKEKCDLPLRISYLTYINFIDSGNQDIELRKLYGVLGSPLAKLPLSAKQRFPKNDKLKTIIIAALVITVMILGVFFSFETIAKWFGQSLSTPIVNNIPNQFSTRGTLAYIAAGNAWVMESDTTNRRLIVDTGDLDGYIFSLSYDGKWLLFTRKSAKPVDEEINTLWVINVMGDHSKMINLGVSNVVHFAEFAPDNNQVVYYSTVEPRSTAPGWQANNDLKKKMFDAFDVVSEPTEIIAPNSGGVYGWWGINYVWSPSGEQLAYSLPDSIGLVDLKMGVLRPLMDNTPLDVESDWALVSAITWGADGRSIFAVIHAQPPEFVNPEKSPYYDLVEVSLARSTPLVRQSGMFAFPNASPLYNNVYYVAYFQAIHPDHSSTSPYQLAVMNSDGSNQRVLFPLGDMPGIVPQKPLWSPSISAENPRNLLAVVYLGNIWLVDINTGESYQLTSDGLTIKIDWK